ncbi:MAG: aspartate kinase, partial [Muribaculaceae bacterium]|nr:aspartate kinase [Muribaculaceae bacterium]
IYMHERGVNSVLIPALDFMRTDKNGEPDTQHIKQKLTALLDKHADADLFITQGYICRNAYGEVDNLQRGGSDYTASLIGAAINADEIEIWTDIDGMHDNDPRYVENTSPVSELHFEEAAELAYFGAKILHPTCVLPAKLNNIPVRLLNTMQPDAKGTLIYNSSASCSIKAVAAKDNITAIKIKSGRMLLAYGFLRKVFEIFETYQTPIDMIATSEVGVSVTIDNERNLHHIVDDLKKFGTVTVDRDMVIICVVGDLEWHNRGFESKALEALKDIPVRMVSYGGSNYNISFLVRKDDKVKALNALSAHLFNH